MKPQGQAKAAAQPGVTQARVSDIKRGKIDSFSLDSNVGLRPAKQHAGVFAHAPTLPNVTTWPASNTRRATGRAPTLCCST